MFSFVNRDHTVSDQFGCQTVLNERAKSILLVIHIATIIIVKEMPSVSLRSISLTVRVVLLNFAVVLLLLLASLGAGSLDFNETIVNLEEGSTLNYSTGVEASESSQLIIYVCITKNSSTTYEDFDLNTSQNSGRCAVCDSRQNCTHKSAINVIINRLQNDSIQLYVVTFFKEKITHDDDGTKIVCAYEDGNATIMPCSWIYLDVHFLPKPENPINILVPVAVSLSSVVVDLLIMLLIVVIFAVVITRRRKRSELMALQGV